MQTFVAEYSSVASLGYLKIGSWCVRQGLGSFRPQLLGQDQDAEDLLGELACQCALDLVRCHALIKKIVSSSAYSLFEGRRFCTYRFRDLGILMSNVGYSFQVSCGGLHQQRPYDIVAFLGHGTAYLRFPA